MYQLQQQIELTYGKQHIKDVVLKEIDPESKIVQSIIDKINTYRHKTYSYKSKNKRVKSLRPSSIQITIDLIIAVITVEEVVTPVQVVMDLIILVVSAGILIGAVMLAIDFFTDGKGLCGESNTKQETIICKTLKD